MQIDKIIQMAKDSILKNGSHIPTMYIEFESGSGAIALLPTAFDSDRSVQKIRNFYTAGAIIGRKHLREEIASLALVVEAWMSSRPANNPNFDVAPSKDPHRTEVLIIMRFDPSDGKVCAHVVEMIRDRQGKLIDLFARQDCGSGDENAVVNTNLFASFIAGFESTRMTDEEKRDIVAKVANQHGIDLTGEEVAKFVDHLEDNNVHGLSFTVGDRMPKRGNVLRKKGRKTRGW